MEKKNLKFKQDVLHEGKNYKKGEAVPAQHADYFRQKGMIDDEGNGANGTPAQKKQQKDDSEE